MRLKHLSYLQLKIMNHTNKHANDYSNIRKNPNWKYLDQTEFKAFLGLLILIGVTKGNQENTRGLWCSRPLSQPIFKAFILLKFVN